MHFAHLFSPHNRRITAGFAVVLLLIATMAGASRVDAAGGLRVSAQGDCLNLRGSAGVAGGVIACVPDGTPLVNAGQNAQADGVGWTLVRWGEVIGWASSQYLADENAPSAPNPTPAPAATATTGAALSLRTPPTGGLTVGLVSLVSPKAIVAAQSFDVTSLSLYDSATLRFSTYIPGSPVNTIGDQPLPPNSAVFLRRRGDLPASLPGPAAATSTAGAPSVLAAPPLGGTVAGVAGTGDLAALVTAQPFAVESISVWDTSSQRWMIYISGAPQFVSTLRTGLLASESVIFVRRSAVPGAGPVAASALAPAPTPAPSPAAAVPTPAPIPVVNTTGTAGLKTVSYGRATVTFYYCAPGILTGAVGDGGGFCGHMANGELVHAGAASCASVYMGQRFMIVGDPLSRIYTCKDTGGAVTTSHRDIWFANGDEGGDWWHKVGYSAEILVIVP